MKARSKLSIKTAIIVIIILGFGNKLYAQQINISKAPISPSKTIYQIFEDAKGYYWIGTKEGLYRFDGRNYKYYQSDNYTNPVSCIQQDKEGRIWCRNFAGQIFMVSDNKLKLYKDLSDKFSSLVNFSVHLFPTIIFRGYGDKVVFKSNFYTKKLICIDSIFPAPIYDKTRLKPNLGFQAVHSDIPVFFHPSLGNYILKDENTVQRYLSFQSSKKPITYFAIKSHYVIQVSKLTNKKSKILIRNTLTNNTYNIEINQRILGGSIYCQNNKWLWVGTDLGLYRINLLTGLIEKNTYLKNEQISSILGFGKGLLIGTLDNGLYQITNLNTYRITTQNNRIMNLQYHRDIGLLGVSNNGNIFIFDSLGIVHLAAKTSLSGNIKLSYNPFKKSITAFHKIGYKIINNKIKALERDYLSAFKKKIFISKDFSIYMSSNSLNIIGLSKTRYLKSQSFDLSDKTLQYFIKKNGIYTSHYKLAEGRSYDFVYLKHNSAVYYASSLGLKIIKEKKTTPIKFNNNQILINSLAIKNHNILAGSIHGDLLEINDSKIIRNWNTILNHQFNYIRKVNCSKNYIFVLDKIGFYRINIHTQKIGLLSAALGINIGSINDIKIVGNNIYLAGENGIIYFANNLALDTNPTSRVFINSVKVNDVAVNKSKFKFAYNNLSFSFNSLSKGNRWEKKYTYILEGFDKNWNYNKNNIENVEYNNLKPGHYKFIVYALGYDNKMSKNPAIYEFSISKAYYNTWWYRLLGAVLFFGIIGLPLFIKARSVKKENDLKISFQKTEHELAESQLTSLRSQMNPHFIFNALNSIQEFIVLNKTTLASNYLGKFADLMRAYLTQSEKELITLEEEISTLKLYLDVEKTRFEDTLTYQLFIDKTLQLSQIKIPPILLQPYIENSFKHGLLHKKTNKILHIKFIKKGNFLQCIIKDNGVGRKKSAAINSRRIGKHKSFATSATQKRLDLLNSKSKEKIEIEILDLKENGLPTGTEVRLLIPLLSPFSNSNEHFEN